MGDWRDGFLFLGNQLSLDLLNTLPVVDGAPVELLGDEAALRRWVRAAGISVKGEGDLTELREFREAWRRVVKEIEAGRAPSKAFVGRLNGLWEAHSFGERLVAAEEGWRREKRYEDALAAVLDSAAELLTAADLTRVRQCDRCVLHFLDVSKKGTRRWCSMRICGNRAKVAAYAERQANAE
jgi:predicted RNA-binding Zn ribbon-like protein